MDRIRNIISTLKGKDIFLLKQYIKCLSRSGKKEQLLQLVQNNPTIDEKKASSYLYIRSSNNIKKLKERLITDIEDIIIIRCFKDSSSSPYKKKESKILYNLLLANFYIQKGLLKEVYLKLSRIKKQLKRQDSLFAEIICQQLWCEYMAQKGENGLNMELKKLSELIDEYAYFNRLRIYSHTLKTNKFSNKEEPDQLEEHGNYHFTTQCEKELTNIKELINKGEVILAEIKAELLKANLEIRKELIPPELFFETLIQIIKINIIQGQYSANHSVFATIKGMPSLSPCMDHEYSTWKFINHFKLEEYEQCHHILKYMNIKFPKREDTLPASSYQSKYFEICLSFNKNEYKRVLKMIALLPGRKILTDELFFTIQMIEIYTLALLNYTDMLQQKTTLIKQNIKQSAVNSDKYLNIIEQTEQIYFHKKSPPKKVKQTISCDLLFYELITIEHFEKKIRLIRPANNFKHDIQSITYNYK